MKSPAGEDYSQIKVKWHCSGGKKTLNLIEEKTGTDRWTFTFMVPKGNANTFSRTFRIPLGNIQDWDEKTKAGTEEGFAITAQAYKGFSQAKSRGMKSTKSFYSDLSDVTVRKARSSLSKITKQVTVITAKNACTIKECILNEGLEWIKGAAFYQLVKTEKKVQPYKIVAVRVLTSGEIYAGSEARVMLGIDVPDTVRLVPKEHGKFDVFIQSTSINRKIPKGTDVLYWPKVGTQRK